MGAGGDKRQWGVERRRGKGVEEGVRSAGHRRSVSSLIAEILVNQYYIQIMWLPNKS